MSCRPPACLALVERCSRPRDVTIKCCKQVKKRLNVLGGIPWEVSHDPLQSDRAAATLAAVKHLWWDNLVSGFTPEAVVAGMKTGSLFMLTVPNWKLVSIAVWWSVALQACHCRVLQSPTPAYHCCAGDFTTWHVTFASNQMRRRVAKRLVQIFARQQSAFWTWSGNQCLSVSTLFLQ